VINKKLTALQNQDIHYLEHPLHQHTNTYTTTEQHQQHPPEMKLSQMKPNNALYTGHNLGQTSLNTNTLTHVDSQLPDRQKAFAGKLTNHKTLSQTFKLF
jgi:hypothetical protein